MRRILFVDDEPMVLAGLQGMLRKRRREWDMVFVGAGEEALSTLAASEFDVIVSDMRMPRMDGATLLREVQRLYPAIVRIVLSGYTEMDAAMRTVSIAHQFLTKPCDPDTLRSTIERACGLQELLKEDLARRVVGRIERLPSLPRTYRDLNEALAVPDRPLPEIVAILERDVAMCAKLLQLVNSSFFGLPRRITSVQHAVAYLGANMLRQVVLSVEAFRSFSGADPKLRAVLEELQPHSLLTAQIARRIAGAAKADDAFMAGMLHDVGTLVLAANLPEPYQEARELALRRDVPVYVAEAELLGVSHAEVGAYLLGLWGLAYPIVEAVAHHHEPARVDHATFDLLDVVHVAQCLAEEAMDDGPPTSREVIDREWLSRFRAESQLSEWRRTAHDQASEARAARENG